MSKLSFIAGYLKYFFTAQTRHNIHSPFVYNLVNEVFNDKKKYPEYKKIENFRKQLLQNQTVLASEDFGAGSLKPGSGKNKKSTVSSIVQSASGSPRYTQLLFRLAKFLQPETLVELGTSLGISAMYQASAVPDSKIVTCEGSNAIADEAKKNFDKMQLENIEIVTGNFDETFGITLSRFETIDWIFFDGNHRRQATLNYFNEALKKINDKTIFIFDDINWSNEMKEAWLEISQHEKVVVSIDIFRMGFVFFNKDLSRQHFVIRY